MKGAIDRWRWIKNEEISKEENKYIRYKNSEFPFRWRETGDRGGGSPAGGKTGMMLRGGLGMKNGAGSSGFFGHCFQWTRSLFRETLHLTYAEPTLLSHSVVDIPNRKGRIIFLVYFSRNWILKSWETQRRADVPGHVCHLMAQQRRIPDASHPIRSSWVLPGRVQCALTSSNVHFTIR